MVGFWIVGGKVVSRRVEFGKGDAFGLGANLGSNNYFYKERHFQALKVHFLCAQTSLCYQDVTQPAEKFGVSGNLRQELRSSLCIRAAVCRRLLICKDKTLVVDTWERHQV